MNSKSSACCPQVTTRSKTSSQAAVRFLLSFRKAALEKSVKKECLNSRQLGAGTGIT